VCGVIGFVHRGQPCPLDRETFRALVQGLRHRGPDGWGEAWREDFTFGHTRLEVIDPGEEASQPMTDCGGTVTLTFSGEVYNYRELRSELRARGHRFRTSSDTEVVLEAYKEWGFGSVQRLDGIYAFGLYDSRLHAAWLVRDRLGVKPLYYAWRGGVLSFCSELKGIVGQPGFPRRLDLRAVSSFLSYRYPLGELTYFADVRQLRPGHHLVLDGPGRIREAAYWDAPPAGGEGRRPSKDELRGLLELAVARQAVADRPLGAYLSGGLDSTILVHELARATGEAPRTFAVGLDDPELDESGHAERVAAQLGTRHTTVRVSMWDCLERWTELVSRKDQPLGMHNEVALYVLARRAKRDVAVVQAGEGADELFGGYGRLFRTPFEYRRMRAIELLPAAVARAARERVGLREEEASRDPLLFFLGRYGYLSQAEKRFLLTPEVTGSGADEHLLEHFRALYAACSGSGFGATLAYLLVKVHLPGLLLMIDSSSMAAGLEVRVPFADHRLVEAALSMPAGWRLRWRSPWAWLRALGEPPTGYSEVRDVPKAVLKELYAGRIPPETAARRKLGFPVPLDRWFRAEMGRLLDRHLLDPSAASRSFLEPRRLREWLAWARSRPDADFGRKAWLLLNLEYWLRLYFAGETLDLAG
jgi:asparagine synthase (glutamine-hydrolysing)